MKKTFKVLAVVLAVAMLSALCAVFAAADAPTGLLVDLEKVTVSRGAKVTLTSSNENVFIYGSLDGENFYELNAGAAVAVTDGVATCDLNMANANFRADLNVRYILVQDATDASAEVKGTVEIIAGEADSAMDPEGPYTMTGLNEAGYGIMCYSAADAADGFGLNAQDVFTSNEKAVKLNSCQITIAEKAGEGVYKILWNDCNGWTKETGAAHLNTPDGVEGVKYENDKVYLADDQVVLLIMSSGGYNTANDAEYSTAKWVMRGMAAGDYFQVGEGNVKLLKSYDSEAGDEPSDGEPKNYLWLHADDADSAPVIEFKVPADGFEDGPISIKALVKFGDDCTGNGSVYLNVYPYNGESLLNWKDYAVHAYAEADTWYTAELVDHDPVKGDTKPDKYSFGMGFYQATGTLNVASIEVSQNGKVVWSVEFTDESVIEDAVKVNVTKDNKDVNWGFVKAEDEPEPQPTVDPDAGYAEAIAAKVGDANDSNLFKTELAAELNDGNITLTMKISNLKADDKVIGFQIPVYFDAERVEAVLDDIKDEALNCVAEDGMPGSNWENLTAAKVVEKNGESYIYFQCGTAKTDYCDENTELVATFKFTLKEGFDKAGFWTANATTKCFIDDGQMTTKLGEGSSVIAEEAAVQPTPTPVTPTPTPTPSETPGDAGIIVFAILGVMAVIGAAVVIKVRK